MAEQKIGNAYLEVVPKVSKNFGSELKSQTKAAGASAGESTGAAYGGGFSAKMQTAIGAGAVFVGNTLFAMAQTAVSAIGDMFSDMFDSFATFETQKLSTEAIFNDADVSQILADARSAYSSLNMSANDYLASISKVGATFSATMGDQRGYETAARGMQAIADYANGTGLSLSTLQDKYRMITRATSSYVVIADQFAGVLPQTTKDFLEQAQAAGFLSDEYSSLTEVPIDEYQEAVTLMLERGVEQMGLLGSTTERSATTIKGSMGQMQAAWDNFLTAVGDGGRTLDLTETVDALLESTADMLANAIPTIGRIAASLVMRLPSILLEALRGLPEMLKGAVTDAFGEDAGAMFDPLIKAMDSIITVANTVWPTVQNIVSTAVSVIGEVVSQYLPIVGNIVATVFSAIQNITEAVWPYIAVIVDIACSAIEFAVESFRPLVNLVQSIFEGIQHAIEDPIGAAADFVQSIPGKILGFFAGLGEKITNAIGSIHFPTPHISWETLEIFGMSTPISLPHISWYGHGGYVDDMTIFGSGNDLVGVGENGGEMIWPSREPWLSTYADALAESMDERGAGDTFVFNITADSETTLQSLVAQAQRARIAYGRA